jgi:hypothetical protein
MSHFRPQNQQKVRSLWSVERWCRSWGGHRRFHTHPSRSWWQLHHHPWKCSNPQCRHCCWNLQSLDHNYNIRIKLRLHFHMRILTRRT